MANLAVVLLSSLLLIAGAASAGKAGRSGWITTKAPATVAPTGNPANPGEPRDAMDSMLDEINEVRELYGVDPVVIDPTLKALALKCANILIHRSTVPNTPDTADNPRDVNALCYPDEPALQYFRFGPATISNERLIAQDTTAQWIRAEQDLWESTYASNPRYDESTRHFTQIVWKSLTKIGCAVSADLRGNQKLLLCYFNPAGNIQYGENNLEFRKNIPLFRK